MGPTNASFQGTGPGSLCSDIMSRWTAGAPVWEQGPRPGPAVSSLAAQLGRQGQRLRRVVRQGLESFPHLPLASVSLFQKGVNWASRVLRVGGGKGFWAEELRTLACKEEAVCFLCLWEVTAAGSREGQVPPKGRWEVTLWTEVMADEKPAVAQDVPFLGDGELRVGLKMS